MDGAIPANPNAAKLANGFLFIPPICLMMNKNVVLIIKRDLCVCAIYFLDIYVNGMSDDVYDTLIQGCFLLFIVMDKEH